MPPACQPEFRLAPPPDRELDPPGQLIPSQHGTRGDRRGAERFDRVAVEVRGLLPSPPAAYISVTDRRAIAVGKLRRRREVRLVEPHGERDQSATAVQVRQRADNDT